MFRDSARAFATDERARAAARRGVDRGYERTQSAEERSFLYMPFIHSENIADQDRCVALFASAPPDQLRHVTVFDTRAPDPYGPRAGPCCCTC